MEWVETTGSSVEEAKDLALDRLGVAESDAEFEVLEEPRAGLFGRLRGDARVRARVRPQAPPPKIDRRDRRRRRRDGDGGGGDGGGGDGTGDAPRAQTRNDTDHGSGGQGGGGQAGRARRGAADQGGAVEERATIDPEEQAGALQGFLEGLLEAFGAEGEVHSTITDEGDIELTVTGDDLGLLIGPRGATLGALQELTRTVSQRIAGGGGARVRVDVNGYRQRRREALARFAAQLAEQVRESGEPKALEPMGPADRKVVHDTVNEIDGVTTISEGQDDERHVVILPES